MPQLQLRDHPRARADSLIEGFPINSPAESRFHSCRYGRDHRHIIINQNNGTAASDAHNGLLCMIQKSIPILAREYQFSPAR